MFTGIVQQTAQVVSNDENALLCVRLKSIATPLHEGDSVAVNGVCLTVVSIEENAVSFDLGTETRRITTLGSLANGDEVNVEFSLKVGDAMHGHFVLGHVDVVGELLSREEMENTVRFVFSLSKEIERYVVPRGSITVDGVSLTVGEVEEDRFSVYIIPHTLKETRFRSLEVGMRVNIEIDCIARYLEKLAKTWT